MTVDAARILSHKCLWPFSQSGFHSTSLDKRAAEAPDIGTINGQRGSKAYDQPRELLNPITQFQDQTENEGGVGTGEGDDENRQELRSVSSKLSSRLNYHLRVLESHPGTVQQIDRCYFYSLAADSNILPARTGSTPVFRYKSIKCMNYLKLQIILL